MIDWSFRAGDLVTVVGYIFVGLSVIFMMRNDIRSLAVKVSFLKDTVDKQSIEIGKFGELLTIMARFEERLVAIRSDMQQLRKDIDELRHGKGFIGVDLARKGRSNE